MARPVRLEEIRFTFRCQEAWSEMSGDGAVRHCGHCDKDVHDLSALGRADAEALLRETRGKICVRMSRTADGRVVTADDRPGAAPVARCGSFTATKLRPARRTLWRRLSTGAAAAAVVLQPGACETGGGATSAGLLNPDGERPHVTLEQLVPEIGEPPRELQMVMGRMAMPLEVPPAQPVTLTPVSGETPALETTERLGGIGYLSE